MAQNCAAKRMSLELAACGEWTAECFCKLSVVLGHNGFGRIYWTEMINHWETEGGFDSHLLHTLMTKR